jgi:hypothetical protein
MEDSSINNSWSLQASILQESRESSLQELNRLISEIGLDQSGVKFLNELLPDLYFDNVYRAPYSDNGIDSFVINDFLKKETDSYE